MSAELQLEYGEVTRSPGDVHPATRTAGGLQDIGFICHLTGVS